MAKAWRTAEGRKTNVPMFSGEFVGRVQDETGYWMIRETATSREIVLEALAKTTGPARIEEYGKRGKLISTEVVRA